MSILRYVPPSRLRDLPSDLVTREHADVSRVHENDPDHIVNALVKKYLANEGAVKDHGEAADNLAAGAIKDRLQWHPDQGPLPITPYVIDILRMRTIVQIAKQVVKYSRMGVYKDGKEVMHELRLRHLWFPENRASRMELRDGAAPPDKKRPAWLKGYELNIDPFDWPPRIRQMLKEKGISAEPILALLRKRAKGLLEVSPW